LALVSGLLPSKNFVQLAVIAALAAAGSWVVVVAGTVVVGAAVVEADLDELLHAANAKIARGTPTQRRTFTITPPFVTPV
jgi:hypothetical protein